MYSYTYDVETGGILLNSSPTNFSKEPRPVYASELDLLGFDKYWKYEKQNDVPYLWAEAGQYLYRGQVVARVKGGSIYSTPEIILSEDENGNVILPEGGGYLKQIDIQGMIYKNQDILNIIEETTVKKIIGIYQKYLNRVDIFHVAFSGGKDSLVLLDLVRRALPKKSFVVVFGDTGMEFPDTYKLVEQVKKECEGDEIPFYVSHSHFKPCESWKLFGPPARVLRWCCNVHKSAPQTLKLREITGKNDYVGMDFVGVRKHESVSRSEYEYENFGKKQKGQYSHNSILEWTSAEVWLYIFSHNLPVNEAYKKGNSRAGCLFCPMGGGKGDYLQFHSYPDEVGQYVEMIKSMNGRYKTEEELQSYVANGGWNARKNGRDLAIEKHRYEDKTQDGKVIISVSNPTTDWREWIKTVGELPFDFSLEETKNGYKVIFDAKMTKSYPKEAKKLKQVFKKASSCVGCRVCETNCRNGCISFKGGLSITDCIACGQCHEIDDGCLVYHSLRSSTGGNGMRKGSLNSFANHAPKTDWVREFFEEGNDFWELNSLGPNQVPMFKRFLRECNIVDKENKTTKIYDLISELTKLLGHKERGILTAYRYASGGITTPRDLYFAIQESVKKALVESGATYLGENSLKESVIAWIEANRDVFDLYLKRPEWEATFSQSNSEEVLNVLKKKDNVKSLMDNIFRLASKEGITAMMLDADSLKDWLKDIISGNHTKIVMIWDEFSGFFIRNRASLDEFQKIVALCQEAPFYLVVVTHQTESIINSEDNSWKVVQQRFNFSQITLPDNIAFELIGHAFNVKPAAEEMWNICADDLNNQLNASRSAVMSAAKGLQRD